MPLKNSIFEMSSVIHEMVKCLKASYKSLASLSYRQKFTLSRMQNLTSKRKRDFFAFLPFFIFYLFIFFFLDNKVDVDHHFSHAEGNVVKKSLQIPRLKQTNKQANIRTDKTKKLYNSYLEEIVQRPLKNFKWFVP